MKNIKRRDFIAHAAACCGGTASFLALSDPAFAGILEHEVSRIKNKSPLDSASDEDFWAWVRSCFTVSATIINLNNGGVSPQPKIVQDAHIRNYQLCNEGPSYYMWRILDMGREPLRAKLALMAGCETEEIAINRNSTEGLNSVIFGLNLKAGDEVILSKYDYPNMMNAWKQRSLRDGIKLVWLDIKQPTESEDELVNLYLNAITPKTKVVHITHMINWTGQILPVKRIAEGAKSKGCEVIVDGAHTFSQMDYKVSDLNCDYYAASLHKWLHAPFGSGLLYVRKEKIKNIWPLLSAPEPQSGDIRKFENLGTRSFASEMAIGNAIEFSQTIGIARKEARLRYLKDYWTGKVKSIPKVSFNTSLLPAFSCALCNFSMEGWKASDIEAKLFEKKKIHSVAIEFEKVNGVRITPSVYTSLNDLDLLVKGIEEISKMNPPAKK